MSRANWIRIVLVAVVILIAILALRLRGAAAQDGDPSSGRRLAQAWCAECHAIDSKTPRSGIAPDFTEIARRPSTTALSLNVFLRSSHRTMPNFIVAGSDADDIVAYILSLKRG